MSSAAKLRNRGIAIAGATALVMTSFGPAAFAWDGTSVPAAATANSSSNGVASIGLVDTDRAKAGTQGATVVSAGATGQAMGEVRFVLPSTFKKGDYVDFTVAPGSTASGTGSKLISYSGTPAVTIDPKAYATNTHVADKSGVSTVANDGSVEDGHDVAYTGTGSPVAPTFSTEVRSSSNAALNDVVRVTFTNDSSPTARDAKFIGALNAKVDVGDLVRGDVQLTAASGPASSQDPADNVVFRGDANNSTKSVTHPATVAAVQMTVENGAVTADGTYQFVGPITVTPANGTFDGSTAVAVTVDNGVTFDPSAQATVTYYDANGKTVGVPAKVSPSASNSTLSVTPGASVTKAVFSNMAIKAPVGTQTFRYNLSSPGVSGALTTYYLGGGAGATAADFSTAAHQVDIVRPDSLTSTATTATQVPSRLGGQDRYQTAVKVAENDLADGSGQVSGESDNVVIASGEGFADALSAGYLAATKNAQLILTRQGSLPQTDIEFLKTYGAKNVFIVGGAGSVSSSVEDQLRNLQSFDVQVQQQMETVTSTVYRTTLSAPSAGTISPMAPQDLAQNRVGQWSIAVTRAATSGQETITGATLTLPNSGGTVAGNLTNPGTNGAPGAAEFVVDGKTYTLTIPASTAASTTITTNATTQQVQTSSQQPVAGQTQFTDATAYGTARKIVPLDTKLTVSRIAGADRFETNKKVNMYAAETNVKPVGKTTPEYGKAGKKTAILANGIAPWDALAAGPLVGNSANEDPIPVILTRGDTMNRYAADQIAGMDIAHLLFIGGEGVLPASLAKETNDRGVSLTRIGGNTRWATAKAVSDFALKPYGVSSTNTSGGFGFATSTTVNPYLANGGSIDGSTGSAVAQAAWADALAAGPSAARQRTIVALTDSVSLPADTKALLEEHKSDLEPVIALGLGGAVSTAAVNAANAAVAGK